MWVATRGVGRSDRSISIHGEIDLMTSAFEGICPCLDSSLKSASEVLFNLTIYSNKMCNINTLTSYSSNQIITAILPFILRYNIRMKSVRKDILPLGRVC